MSRPLRIEFAGALYHVMARSDARAAIFLDDADRETFVSVCPPHVLTGQPDCFDAFQFSQERSDGQARRGRRFRTDDMGVVVSQRPRPKRGQVHFPDLSTQQCVRAKNLQCPAHTMDHEASGCRRRERRLAFRGQTGELALFS